MSLHILNNNLAGQVMNDLKRICPDPALEFDVGLWMQEAPGLGEVQRRGSGKVSYVQRLSSVGCNLIAFLVSDPAWVGIRGETPSFSTRPSAGYTLKDLGGATVYDVYPDTTTVEIVYDATDCDGHGQFVHDAAGNKLDYPTDVSLFHELAHAQRLLQGRSDSAQVDEGVIDDENEYRDSIRPGWRRDGYTGGCNAPPFTPAPPDPPIKGKPGCFIATAAYGSPLEPEVEFLRRFRDDVLRKTRSGREFFDRYWEHYYKVSPAIADLMWSDPQVRQVIRWSVVTPVVRHLQLLLRFPDAPINGLEEPWRSFLREMRDGLEEWAQAIELPYDFDGLPAHAAAEEIEIVLRYALRRAESRAAYLRRLEELGQLPLRTDGIEREEIAERLRSSGRSEAEVQRILGQGVVSGRRRTPPRMLGGRGPDHVFQEGEFQPTEWIYTVTIQNLTQDFFDEIAVFYNQTDLTGVVYLGERNVLPGDVRVFRLGVCNKMNHYVLGLFQGNELVGRLPPDEGQEMTPQLAGQLNPTDTEPCADSWRITPP